MLNKELLLTKAQLLEAEEEKKRLESESQQVQSGSTYSFAVFTSLLQSSRVDCETDLFCCRCLLVSFSRSIKMHINKSSAAAVMSSHSIARAEQIVL